MLHLHDTMTIYKATYPAGSGDSVTRYGDAVRVEDNGTEVPCQVRPQGRGMEREEFDNMDRRLGTYHVICPPFDFDGLARIEWADRSWEVIGEPQPYHFRNGPHHVEFAMRGVEGG